MKPLLILLGLLSASPARAAEPACEFHVWPSNSTGAVTAGVLSNFGPLGAYADLQSNRDATMHDQVTLIETLTVPRQAQAVMTADLPQLLGLGQVRLIFQRENFDPRTATRQTIRMTNSTAPCYAELIVSLNEYRNSAVRGASLKTELTFKDFRNGRPRITTASQAAALRHFPARTPEQKALAELDISDAFAANLRTFAKRVAKRRR